MTKTLEELLKLSPAERAEIAVTLWDSVAESEDADVLPLSPELKAELDRRLADLESNPGASIPWDEALRRLRSNR